MFLLLLVIFEKYVYFEMRGGGVIIFNYVDFKFYSRIIIGICNLISFFKEV